MATLPYGEDHEMKVLSERGEADSRAYLELLASGFSAATKSPSRSKAPKELELADKLVVAFLQEFDFPRKPV
jgi:hypothetical protein